MKVLARLLALTAGWALLVLPGRAASPAADHGVHIAAGAASLASGESDAAALAGLRAWDAQVTAFARDGQLHLVSTASDTLIAGRTHQRFDQQHDGVAVFGGGMTRQLNSFGQAESIFGTYYPDIDIDVTPAFNAAVAETRLAAAGSGVVRHGRFDRVALQVLPLDDGTYRLTWSGRVLSPADGLIRRVFIDAKTGETVHQYVDTETQSPTSGKGNGVLGDQKKISVDLVNGMYLTIDQLRPSGATFGLPAGANITFDMKGSLSRFLSLVVPLQSDIGSDADNVWSDPGVISNPGIVDAHAYAGYTYDFYFRRLGRQGLDDANLQIWSFTNIVRATDWPIYFNQFSAFFVNAAYLGGGDIYYGSGLPSNITFSGKFWANFAGALDVVAHELSHGVTDFSSKLIYQGESGALNEAFSDMMGQSAQFFIKPPADNGASGFDWLIGEDIAKAAGSGLNGLRSMAAPFTTFGDPDHYSIRYTGAADNGGVHTNSGIMNHVFYLAIMGGTNRVSNLATTGVGFANRDQIERVIYRAFTQLLTSSSNFAAARAATVQAARDLFGTNSAAEQALTQAWTAVGVV